MPARLRDLVVLLLVLMPHAGGWLALPAQATEPLPAQIDRLIAARAGGPTVPLSDDAEFLRRAYLDFAGRIPSASETRAFLESGDGDKRAALVDRLSDSPEFVRHMTEFLHVMLMERLGDDPHWRTFLQHALAENQPWDELVRQILYPTTTDEQQRGAAFFYTKRLEHYGQNPIDMPGLVRDVGRLFLGVDLQCCECHDHLFVDDYKQETYQGLFAFVGQTFIRQDVEFPAVGEKPLMEKVAFKSVFLMEDRETGPRLLDGPEVEIPELAKGEEYLEPPDRKTRFPGIPKFSTLQILAEQLSRRGNPAFERNIVNRLWWKLMGRGLVDPLDLHHSDNPPSHPELLALLGEQFREHHYDLKWMLQQLARSQTYQRSTRGTLPSDSEPGPATYRRALERPLSAEQMLASARQATGPPTPLSTATVTAPAVQGAATDDESADEPDESDELAELRERFLAVLANPPREPEIGINPTVKAALFLMNDDAVLQLLQPRENNLTARLDGLAAAEDVAEELYVSVLSRLPSADERAEVAEYLAAHADERAQALTDLAWALLASVEFCVNH